MAVRGALQPTSGKTYRIRTLQWFREVGLFLRLTCHHRVNTLQIWGYLVFVMFIQLAQSLQPTYVQ